MALLKPNNKTSRTQIRVHIDSEILKNIQAYCDWASFDKVDEFVEKAAKLVFKKDRDWCQHQ